MSDDIKGIPYSIAEFDKEGKPLNEPAVPADTTDLIVVSHGWNNDRQAAETLYHKLFENFADVTENDADIKARRIAIVGIIWPSKKIDELMTEISALGAQAGGAAAVGGHVDKAASQAAIHDAIDRVAPLFDDADAAGKIAALHEIVPQLDDDTDAQEKFVETLRKLVEPRGNLEGEHSKNDGSAFFFEDDAGAVFERAAQEPVAAPPAEEGGDAVKDEGAAAGFVGDLFSGAARAAKTLLNLMSYYEMKKRAGTVGKNGVAPLIDKLSQQLEKLTRIHLVGHSFGGRVVAAAAANSTTDKLHSLSLLQAAFSHNAFSRIRNGFFRSVVDNRRIKGPILVTHTRKDTAVGRAYPLASRISGSNADSLGDANDEFGGLGSNGAQRMEDGEIVAEINAILPVGQPYAWQPGKFHNLEGGTFLADPQGGDAHGFVWVPQVGWAISRAIVS